MTVANKPGHRGSTKETVKTIARGMPGDPGVTVVTMLVCFFYFAHKAAGALSARHSLRPLFSWADDSCTTRAYLRREIAAVHPDVIARSEATKQSTLSLLLRHGLLRFARNDGCKPLAFVAV